MPATAKSAEQDPATTPANHGRVVSRREVRELAERLPDSDVEALLHDLLNRRRSEERVSARDSVVREISFTQRLDAHVQRHLNVLAERAYSGRHPKHWLWKSHKQFFLDRLRPGERVLDVGCGASAYLLWMAERGCRVTGCDINPARVEQARQLMSHPNLQFEVRDVTRALRSGEERFDVAICSHVIEHLDDPTAMLASLHKHAQRLLVAVPPSDNRWQKVMFRDLGLAWKDDEDHRREYTPELLRVQLAAAGWRVVELHAGVDIKAVCVPDAGAGDRPISYVPGEFDERAYLELQAERSKRKANYDSMKRSGYLAERLAAHVPDRSAASVLCVGSRNRCELDCLSAQGFGEITAIDLHAGDPRILVMDMHALRFADSSFDAVFTSHSFEHAHDPRRVASEIRRVLRPGGFVMIEVPVGYTPTGVDLWDFVSEKNLASYFEPCEVLWSERGPQLDAPHQTVIRLLLRVLSPGTSPRIAALDPTDR